MDAKGQSLIEIVLVLPVLFLFVTILFKLNLATQMSINNAQYARSQLFVLTANSPEYPRLSFRFRPGLFKNAQQDLMILGVSDPKAIKLANYSADDGGGGMEAIPQTQKLDRLGRNIEGSDERGEQAKRNEIRVRNTASICTQMNQSLPNGEVRWPFKQMVCQYGANYWIGSQ
jgi:hypothetical protein